MNVEEGEMRRRGKDEGGRCVGGGDECDC